LLGDASYQYRKLITINKNMVVGTHTDFPVLINLTLDSTKVTSANGYDIIFTNEYSEKLDHEIESYDNGTGELHAWVRVPTLSDLNDTKLYMYYGDSSITTDPSSTAVWDSSYAGVWHLDESPANGVAGHIDSTAHSNDGTPQAFDGTAGSTTTATGKISAADKFDGTDDHVIVPYDASLNITTEITLSAWINVTAPENDGQWYNVVIMENSTDAPYALYLGSQPAGETYISAYFQINGNKDYWTPGSVEINPSLWVHVAVTFDGTDFMFYTNSVHDDTRTEAGALDMSNVTMDLLIGGKWQKEAIGWWDGLIDEVRVSNKARSAGWIETCFNNQNDTSVGSAKFIRTVGPEQAMTW
jgi:hypothetical protein